MHAASRLVHAASIVTPTCQIQLRVIGVEVNVDVVFGGDVAGGLVSSFQAQRNISTLFCSEPLGWESLRHFADLVATFCRLNKKNREKAGVKD